VNITTGPSTPAEQQLINDSPITIVVPAGTALAPPPDVAQDVGEILMNAHGVLREVPATIGSPGYFIMTYKLTRDQAIAIIRPVFAKLPRGSTQKMKAINKAIKTRLKPKANYREKKWKPLIREVASWYNITLKAR
jgi:hypothetical protein